MNKILFFLFPFFTFRIDFAGDFIGPDGKSYFLFSDGTYESNESICQGSRHPIKIQLKGEWIYNPETQQRELVECREEFKSFMIGRKIEDKKIQSPLLGPELVKSEYSFEKFLYEQKYSLIAAGAVFSIYSYLMLKLYCAKNFVNKEVTWSSFYKSLPIESLYEISPKKFLADLEVVIYRTFADDEKNINYKDTEPLYLFVKAVERELKNLEKFVNLYWYCSLPGISFLFPNYDEELIVAQEKIERLSYMKDLVTKKLIELHV